MVKWRDRTKITRDNGLEQDSLHSSQWANASPGYHYFEKIFKQKSPQNPCEGFSKLELIFRPLYLSNQQGNEAVVQASYSVNSIVSAALILGKTSGGC